jgi:colanic acid biosynthesis glycosyl transferase WcaI
MKILVYGLNYAPELIGIGKYTHEMCEWLTLRGHQVKVVSGYPYYPDWKVARPYRATRFSREQLGGVEIVRCPLYVPTSPTAVRRLLHHLTFAVTSAIAASWMALRFQPEILFAIAPSQFVAPAAFLAGRLTGAKTWLHIQDFEIDSSFELGILSGAWLRRCAERTERMALSRFDRVSTISTKMMERLAQKRVAAAKSVEFRNWVDTSLIRPQDRLTPFRAELGLSSRSIIALYSGSLAVKQGLETLLQAARLLRDTRPEITFVICGQGAMRDRLMKQAGHEPNVRFLELQPQARLSELLSTADIHLLPQRAQVADLVLPSKLAPMLASGRPVVAMAKPGTQLALEVENAGLIIPPDDPAALVAALIRLADDIDLRAKLGRTARAKAQTCCDIQTVLSRLEGQLLALTGPSPSLALMARETEQSR